MILLPQDNAEIDLPLYLDNIFHLPANIKTTKIFKRKVYLHSVMASVYVGTVVQIRCSVVPNEVLVLRLPL